MSDKVLLGTEESAYYVLYELEGTYYAAGEFKTKGEALLFLNGLAIGAEGSDLTILGTCRDMDFTHASCDYNFVNQNTAK